LHRSAQPSPLGTILRVRITQRLFGSIDGVQLSRFETGRVYDVPSALACYLIVAGGALSCIDDSPNIPLDEQGIDHLHELKGSPRLASQGWQAADRPRRRKTR
jgi:hypothetical protein